MTDIYYETERRREAAAMRRKKLKRRRRRRWFTAAVIVAVIVFGIAFILKDTPEKKVLALSEIEIPEWIDSQIMPEEGTSRVNVKLEDINGIVVHYVGNPGTTAQNNRDFYDNEGVEVNSHFVVGLEGEIIQCIPLDEKSSASNHRNRDTISIEVCHPDDTGEFSDVTYNALVKLTAWLCEECGLDADDVIRHYDVTGKMCPLYFVENEDAWLKFKEDVKAELKE